MARKMFEWERGGNDRGIGKNKVWIILELRIKEEEKRCRMGINQEGIAKERVGIIIKENNCKTIE